MKRKQSGMTLIGFIIVLAVVGVFLYMGMKLVPMYSEYYAVKRSLSGLSEEPGIATMDPAKIRDLFFRRMYVNYSENVKQENFKIIRSDKGLQVTVRYEVRKELIANLDVVGKFEAEQVLRSNAGD
jgi:hypothetical protein